MPKESHKVDEYVKSIFSERSPEELRARLEPKFGASPPRMPGGAAVDSQSLDDRWKLLKPVEAARSYLADPQTVALLDTFKNHIENFVGTVKLPVGIAGPLRVNGLFAQGDYYVPMATTEAALVASYNRGMNLITSVGGCSAMILSEGVSRAPGFAFLSAGDAGMFVVWVLSQKDNIRKIVESTTSHGKFSDMRITVEGNHVYLNLEMNTGDASGQNMVTIAGQAVCEFITRESPIKPEYSFVEANLSGDKKANFMSFMTVRGKKVTAEVTIPGALIEKVLHTTSEQMVNYWRMAAIGGVLSGGIGVQGHYANGLAAVFIATGQDAASVAEAAVGVTRFERTSDGGLYAAVTLPNIIVGTVGGGTSLPSQRTCLEIMGLAGAGKARAFAEVCAAMSLAGELSIIGALCAGEFTNAHERLARGGKPPAEKPDVR